ncbi:biotin synthase BioB [Salinarchaeum sp. IM2453]|uniref:biotin synthase BioB n=1 Tax=Salinarchaeum sp. IM2453 TaxID=2862870 RepID=UPI001C8319DC|nr:biotin synthase BioB [Salinarchaeum sp. IM2453]QZA89586.1 biotin synthase BioB [Salinarchaeum sp. IM2453]
MVDKTGNQTIDDAVERVLSGIKLDRADGLSLISQPVEKLMRAADIVQSRYGDNTVNSCSIVNAKSGGCAEDCQFCAQSASFDTDIETHDLLDPDRILTAAKNAERDGISRFGIVIAGRGVNKLQRPEEWSHIIDAIRRVRRETDLAVDASLGTLTKDEAETLADEGVEHYNHNLETSRRYFSEVVSTHTFDDRLNTLENAKEAGMQLCSGVILGMGESPADRIDAALSLRNLGVSSLPINLLNPIPGTPIGDQMQDTAAISRSQLLKTIAVYRLLHPTANVRIAGGREANITYDKQHQLFEAGADGLVTGDYLTTEGQSPEKDATIIRRSGMEPDMNINPTTNR